jgi:ABC-type transport system involved in cytochrome bd biosynthesis fused ATPase/permease subunit
VTLIPQDAEVYEGTIAENLALCEAVSGEPHAEEFLQALQVAKVDDFVDISPEGLNQRIAERGANWSGGQRARLALARGILAARDSQLILLDEPTASLDVRTEAAVHEGIFRLFAQSCVVSSVHRMNLLPQFDEIIMLQDGRVVAQDSLAKLQSQCAEFQALMMAYQKTLGSTADQND